MTDRHAISGPVPPVLFLATLIGMVVLHLVVPLETLLSSGWHWLGAPLIAGGLALNVWADRQFKRAGTAVRPTEPSTSLVVTGPFAFSRNPMYLGMVCMLLGAAVALGSVTPWLLVPVFAWGVTVRFIAPEERKMESTFGDPYLAYKRKVRRWL